MSHTTVASSLTRSYTYVYIRLTLTTGILDSGDACIRQIPLASTPIITMANVVSVYYKQQQQQHTRKHLSSLM